MKKFLSFTMVAFLLVIMTATVNAAGKNIKATGDVYLRKGPGLEYKAVGVLYKGETLKYMNKAKRDSRGIKWYKVSFKKKSAWVSSRYAKFAEKTSKYIRSTGDVYLRKGPGLKYRTIGVLKKGNTLRYAGKTKSDNRGVKWYKVSYKKRSAWISSRYTKFVSKKSATENESKVKTTGSVNLRMGPGLDFVEYASVKEGKTLPYLNESAKDDRGVTWYKVSYNGKELWVSSKYARII